MDDDCTPVRHRDIRAEIIAFLQLLSESERHRDLDLGVAADDVPTELCRYWFDELYTPSRRYLDEVKGDFSPTDASAFNSLFNDSELEALSRFHHFLELRLSMLDSSEHRLAGSDLWASIVRDAQNTLYLLTHRS